MSGIITAMNAQARGIAPMIRRVMTKVLVCGGRRYTDAEMLANVLTCIDVERPIAEVITGGATGADTLAYEWAIAQRIDCYIFPANWTKYGAKAGPLRNAEMLRERRPDLVVAFPGGKGTSDMIGKARAAGIEVLCIPEAEAEAAETLQQKE